MTFSAFIENFPLETAPTREITEKESKNNTVISPSSTLPFEKRGKIKKEKNRKRIT